MNTSSFPLDSYTSPDLVQQKDQVVLQDIKNVVVGFTKDLASTVSSNAQTLREAETESVASSITENSGSQKCTPWDGTKLYSDLIKDGLNYLGKDSSKVIMLYESPSTASKETSFYNSQVFPIHDYPPSDPAYKMVLAPLRYSMMNGSTYPSYLKDAPPKGLLEHWKSVIPDLALPSFTDSVDDPDATVYAYLPLEHIPRHINDPHVHYHLAGKDALHLMTPNTPKYLSNTKDNRPCIAKVTHSMGSKGIFVIRDDDDEAELFEFLESSGRPNYVITEFVDIVRNVSCHFFMHPSGEIVWLGSSENYKDAVTGQWTMDSIILRAEQDALRELQLPYVRQVADYCLSLGFWGFGGVDVLFDSEGRGHVVDFNPRTTGTCPALMALKRLEENYPAGIFRRNPSFAYRGSADQLLLEVEAFNASGKGTILLNSFSELSPSETLVNICVYGYSLEECRTVLDRFNPPRENSESS